MVNRKLFMRVIKHGNETIFIQMILQKKYQSVAYAMDAEALYLSVGLINTSYKEEYSLWVNSEDKVIATWRPNVTYLPEEPDMVWKFTGTFE